MADGDFWEPSRFSSKRSDRRRYSEDNEQSQGRNSYGRSSALNARDASESLGRDPPAATVQRVSAGESTSHDSRSSTKDSQEVKIERLLKSAAVSCLAGLMPYPHYLPKQGRYRRFLELSAEKCSESDFISLYASLIKNGKSEMASQEAKEFLNVATMFKPMSSAFASRFTSSSSSSSSATTTSGNSSSVMEQLEYKQGGLQSIEELQYSKQQQQLRRQSEASTSNQVDKEVSDPLEVKRTIIPWAPCETLCKRFNIAPPATTLEQQQGGDNASEDAYAGQRIRRID